MPARVKKYRHSLKELITLNKKELISDKVKMDQIEKRLEQKLTKRSGN